MAKIIGLILQIVIWAGYGWSIEGCIIATVIAFVAAAILEYFEKKRASRKFFDFSETTCNRCGSEVRAHSRVGAKAFYTCPNCGKSFTLHLYNPDR